MARQGVIQQLRGQNFPFFDLHGQFLYPERGQKQTFFDPLPPHLVHVVIEWHLMCTREDMGKFLNFINLLLFLLLNQDLSFSFYKKIYTNDSK